MTYEIISSNSKGNCVIIDKYLSLDMGISYKRIKDKLKDIKLIFISHSHT